MSRPNTHLLFTHPTDGERIIEYTAGEMREIFSPQESHELSLGRAVFKAGGLWVDMVLAARHRTEEALEG